MEVALTCRAPPSFRSFPYRTRCQVSGARYQVFGTRCEGTHFDSEVSASGQGTVRSEKTTFQAGMCMKTKRTRCQVSGARCQGARLGQEVPAGGCERPTSEKTTFQAGMCKKTKNTVRSPRSEVRSSKGPADGAPVLTPGSLLLTPALQEMKVQPEMLLKTHDREHGTRDTGTRDRRGVQILASAFQGTLASAERGAHASVTGYPGNMLKRKGTPEPNRQSQMAIRQCPGSLLLTPVFQEMKVHPAMSMKIREGLKSYITGRGRRWLKMPGIRCPNNFTPSGEGSLLTGVRPLAALAFGRGADPSSHSWRALKAVARVPANGHSQE